MWSEEKPLDQELYELGQDVKKAWNGLEDFPLWQRSLGVIYANAARGMKIHRKIKSISSEMEMSEVQKLKKYLNGLMDVGYGFHNGLVRNLTPQQEQIAASITADIIREMFEAGNRQAEVRRLMLKGNVPISELRKIADPEVKHIRSTLTGDMKKAMDRNLELPETQMLELALHVLDQGE